MATAAMVIDGMRRLFDGGTLAGRGDGQLLEAFVARRDESAFAALVERHGPMVLATCRAVLRDPAAADDAFQATFLVLARKAGSVRGCDALGGWLHRVAYRAATQSARAAVRRRDEERKAAEMRARREVQEGRPPDDLRAVIHAEVERLPEALRLAVVLCDLEGMTRDRAAEELRWSPYAVRSRLERGRAKLRARLIGRGVAPSAGLLAAAIAAESAAAVPEALAASTVRAVLAGVAGRLAGSSAAVLAGQVVRAMSLARLKTAALMVVAVAVAGGSAGLMMIPAQKPGEGVMPDAFLGVVPATGQGDAPARSPRRPGQARRSRREGGCPAARAPRAGSGRLWASKSSRTAGASSTRRARPSPGRRSPCYSSGVRGSGNPPTGRWMERFRFTVKGDGNLRNARVIAEPEGFSPSPASEGFGYDLGVGQGASPDAGRDLTITLHEDRPIEGRVVDLEGRPVAGATVRAEFVYAPPPGGDLTPWLRAVAAHEASSDDMKYKYMKRWSLHDFRANWVGGPRPHATTDADGRFVLKGIGGERLADLKIEGPTIRSMDVHVITRPSEPFQTPVFPNNPQFPRAARRRTTAPAPSDSWPRRAGRSRGSSARRGRARRSRG